MMNKHIVKALLFVVAMYANSISSQTKNKALINPTQFKYCVWPYSDTIYQNTNFVVEIYGLRDINAHSQNKTFGIFRMVSKNDTIPLEILQTICKDSITQLVLKPKKDLKTNHEYTFLASKSPGHKEFLRKSRFKRINMYDTAAWIVETPKKYHVNKTKERYSLPSWELSPRTILSDKVYTKLPTKPRTPVKCYIKYRYKLNSNSESLIKLTCKNVRTGEIIVHYFDTTEDEFIIGYDRNVFILDFQDPSGVFDLTFEIIDVHSNSVNGFNTITIVSPLNSNYIIAEECANELLELEKGLNEYYKQR